MSRRSVLVLVLAVSSACRQGELTVATVIDKPAVKGTCLDVVVTREGTEVGHARLARDGGTRYFVGVSAPGPSDATFQAFVVVASGCEGTDRSDVRARSMTSKAMAGDGATRVVELTIGSALDADGDGVLPPSEGGNDCDDTNAQVFPGAPQACDSPLDTNCDGLTKCADPTCAMTPSCAQQLVFTAPDASIEAGRCTRVELERRTFDGGRVLEGTEEVTLTATSDTRATQLLYAQEACASPLQSGVVFSPGFGTTGAWVKANNVGDINFTGTWRFGTATARTTVVPARADHLSIDDWPGPVTRFGCTPFTLTTRDRFDNVTREAALVNFVVDAGTLGLSTYNDSDCAQPHTGLFTLLDGGARAFASFRGSGAGVLIAEATGLRTATAPVSLSGGVAITPSLFDARVEAGACVAVRLDRTLLDGGAALSLGLSTVQARITDGGVSLHNNADCSDPGANVVQAQVLNGQVFGLAYARGHSALVDAGEQRLSAAELNGPERSVQVRALPLVRRGTCDLVSGFVTTCPVLPALPNDDISRTVLVTQTTSATPDPEKMLVECHLETDGGVFVSCSHEADAGFVRIGWQTASFGRPASSGPGGVSVVHLPLRPAAASSLISGPVPGSQTFTLYSFRQPGLNMGIDDVAIPTLDQAGLRFSGRPDAGAGISTYSVQLVQLGEANSVNIIQNNETLTGGVLNYPNLPAMDPTRSALLFGAVVDYGAGVNFTCLRSLVGTLDSSTSVRLERGFADLSCTNQPVIRTTLQRAQFPLGTRVVTGAVSLAHGAVGPLEVTLPTATSLAEDRTLVWMAGQSFGGQSGGRHSTVGATLLPGEEDTIGLATGVVRFNGTSWVLERGSPQGPAAFAPQFIEFNP